MKIQHPMTLPNDMARDLTSLASKHECGIESITLV